MVAGRFAQRPSHAGNFGLAAAHAVEVALLRTLVPAATVVHPSSERSTLGQRPRLIPVAPSPTDDSLRCLPLRHYFASAFFFVISRVHCVSSKSISAAFSMPSVRFVW